MGLGTRVPGSAAHDRLADALAERLAAAGAEVHVQPFTARFHGLAAACRNVIGVFRCGRPDAPLALLATHYDTRPIADREPDPALRRTPIPGANDAGSGTAVLLHLLAWLRESCDGGALPRDVATAFVDAEDLGDIDGNPFSLGAEHLAAHPPAESAVPTRSWRWTWWAAGTWCSTSTRTCSTTPRAAGSAADLFTLGASLDLPPFTREKPRRARYLISDQWPFLRRGVPSCLLIDLDYPEWHTQADLPEAMSGESLAAIEAVLKPWLSRPPA